jgi:hypothetical protein
MLKRKDQVIAHLQVVCQNANVDISMDIASMCKGSSWQNAPSDIHWRRTMFPGRLAEGAFAEDECGQEQPSAEQPDGLMQGEGDAPPLREATQDLSALVGCGLSTCRVTKVIGHICLMWPVLRNCTCGRHVLVSG